MEALKNKKKETIVFSASPSSTKVRRERPGQQSGRPLGHKTRVTSDDPVIRHCNHGCRKDICCRFIRSVAHRVEVSESAGQQMKARPRARRGSQQQGPHHRSALPCDPNICFRLYIFSSQTNNVRGTIDLFKNMASDYLPRDRTVSTPCGRNCKHPQVWISRRRLLRAQVEKHMDLDDESPFPAAALPPQAASCFFCLSLPKVALSRSTRAKIQPS